MVGASMGAITLVDFSDLERSCEILKKSPQKTKKKKKKRKKKKEKKKMPRISHRRHDCVTENFIIVW